MSIVVITGAGTGIGKAIALEFGRQGAKLVLCGPKLSELNKVGKSSHTDFIAIKTDVRLQKDIKNLVRRVTKKFGGIDILINNAGIRHIGSVTTTSNSTWKKVIDTNLTGAFLCCKEIVPMMIKCKRGLIINISSVNAFFGVAEGSAYCASKAGMIGLTKSLAKEVQKFNVKVYSVCPYLVNTKTRASTNPKYKKSDAMSPEYVANKIAKLAHSNKPTGSTIIVKKPFWKF